MTLHDRNEKIIELWRGGLTYIQIAEELDISKSTVGNIVTAYKDRHSKRKTMRDVVLDGIKYGNNIKKFADSLCVNQKIYMPGPLLVTIKSKLTHIVKCIDSKGFYHTPQYKDFLTEDIIKMNMVLRDRRKALSTLDVDIIKKFYSENSDLKEADAMTGSDTNIMMRACNIIINEGGFATSRKEEAAAWLREHGIVSDAFISGVYEMCDGSESAKIRTCATICHVDVNRVVEALKNAGE